MVDKFENIQKKCIKWILKEEEFSYQSSDLYIKKCKQVDLLPMFHRFNLNDLLLFHKIFRRLIPVNMPSYLSLFSGNSRLRSCHLDHLSFVSSVLPNGSTTKMLKKSFFYRTHNLWNSLPLNIREILNPSEFKIKVTQHFWFIAADHIEADSHSYEEILSDSSIT